MAAMSMHLKQQLEEVQEEFRIQQQSLQTELDGLLQQNLQLTENMVITTKKNEFRINVKMKIKMRIFFRKLKNKVIAQKRRLGSN